MPTDPNMTGMTYPTESGSFDTWGLILNATTFPVIGAHDHTTGKGVKVPTAGLNINADLSFASAYALTNMLAVDFAAVAPAAVAGYAGAFFVNSSDSNNLYFRTVSGSNVKVTDGTALNVAGFAGGIGGDYTSSSALVAYVAANDIYTFKGPDPGTGRPWEALATGHHDFYEQATTVANRVRIQSPAALAASYALTLGAALPASTSVAQVSSAGVITYSNVLSRSPGFTTSDEMSIFPDTAGAAALNVPVVGTTATTYTIQLPVGSRITGWFVDVNKVSNAATTLLANLNRLTSADGATATISTANTAANAPGLVSIGQTGLTTTIASGIAYAIQIASSTGAADDFGVARVFFDRPT